MELQYISDNDGNHTAVVIPIAEWNDIAATRAHLKELENRGDNRKKKPSDFKGCISKETAIQILTDAELSRNEWERNI